ncbi:MAG: metallophosphoesterase, partial [Deltaproteobacteria bacterium]|nr:metallophosphoesterase [Deltaproteobacteria bacterium]
MILFLLVYISIYGGVHVYAFLKLRKGLELGILANVLMALLMLLMVAAPVVVRLLEHNGEDTLARGLAWVGFVWMGFIFLFISVSFFFDI